MTDVKEDDDIMVPVKKCKKLAKAIFSSEQKDLINHLSMAHNTYVHWRNQKNRSYLKHINEIAEFFGVSPNYLLRGEEASEHHSIYEEEFLRFFRKLNEKNTKLVFELVKTISETQT